MKKNDQFSHVFVITPAIYQGFITLFKDKNPLHVDENFAKSKGFKTIVMHGNILTGFLSNFVGECLPIRNVMLYSEEIKFIKPAFLNDVITFNAEIIGEYEAVKAYEFNLKITNQYGQLIAKGRFQIGEI